MREFDGVLNDIDLRIKIRRNVHRRVGDDERLLMIWHVHDEAMADAAFGADSALARDYGAHELIGVKAALHEGFDSPRGDEADRLRRGVMAMPRGDDLEAADVESGFFRCLTHTVRRGDQDRVDESKLMGLDSAAKRDVVAGMRDGDFDRPLLLRLGDKALIPFAAYRFFGRDHLVHVGCLRFRRPRAWRQSASAPGRRAPCFPCPAARAP